MIHELFEEFDSVSAKQWKQKIQFELNGADYNQTLIWNTPEDIKVKPFYHQDEFLERSASIETPSGFFIGKDIYVFDVEKSAERALSSLQLGASSLRFTIPEDTIEIEKLVQRLPLNNLVIYFNFKFLSLEFIDRIEKVTQEYNPILFYNFDPIGQLAKEGNWFSASHKTNFDFLNLLRTKIANRSFVRVDASLYQNAGANMVQQIAYGVSHAIEYLCRIPLDGTKMVFEVAVGSNYFFEIAKLRAFRLLFDLIAKEYGIYVGCHLVVSPSKRNKTLYANHVNSFRTATESLSAVLGAAAFGTGGL